MGSLTGTNFLSILHVEDHRSRYSLLDTNHVMGTSAGRKQSSLQPFATMVLPTQVSALAALLLLPNNAVDAFSTNNASVRIFMLTI